MNPFFQQTSVARPHGWMAISHITFTWNPNNEQDLAGYHIYKRTLPSINYGLPIFSGLPPNPFLPQITATNLNKNESYGFITTAYDTAENESIPSDEKQITIAATEDAVTSNIEESTLLETTKETNTSIPEEVTVDTSKEKHNYGTRKAGRLQRYRWRHFSFRRRILRRQQCRTSTG